MADITMCSGHNCPKKETCHRYTANKSYWQSYFMEVPYNKEIDNCGFYWDNEETEKTEGGRE